MGEFLGDAWPAGFGTGMSLRDRCRHWGQAEARILCGLFDAFCWCGGGLNGLANAKVDVEVADQVKPPACFYTLFAGTS